MHNNPTTRRVATIVIATICCSACTAEALAWTHQHKLTASDAATDDDFGQSVAISGNTAIVGAYADDDAGSDSGSAYLFNATTGSQLQKLTATDGAAGDLFGNSVGISGNTAIVGARGDENYSGAAYLFDATTGSPLQKLTATDGAADDWFGCSVAISGNTAIVGAHGDENYSGAAYLFNVTTGSQHKLTASDAALGDEFGYSVAISGDTAIVGAYGDHGDGNYTGSAYLFDVATGNEPFKLTATAGTADDGFGYSVAISGNTAIVGAWGDNDVGAAYLFNVATGEQLFKLIASDGAVGDSFGYSVAISGDTAIVGAEGDDDVGSSYLFDVATGIQLQKLIAPDCAFGDWFGCSVGISGDYAVVGACGDGDYSGSAYSYVVPEPSTFVLAGSALLWLAGLCAWRRRKRIG